MVFNKQIRFDFKLLKYDDIEVNNINPNILINWYKTIAWFAMEDNSAKDLTITYLNNYNTYRLEFKTDKNDIQDIMMLIEKYADPDVNGNNSIETYYKGILTTILVIPDLEKLHKDLINNYITYI